MEDILSYVYIYIYVQKALFFSVYFVCLGVSIIIGNAQKL